VKGKMRVGFLALGQPRSEAIRQDYEAGRKLIKSLGYDVFEAGPILEETEVEDAARQLRRQDLDLLITYALQGTTGRVITLAALTTQLPVGVWAIDERYSLPGCALAIGALRQLEWPSAMIHGSAHQPHVRDKIDLLASVAHTKNRLMGSRIGTVGPLFQVQIASHYNPLTLLKRFGTWVVDIPLAVVRQTITDRCMDKKAIQRELERVKETFDVRADNDLIKRGIEIHLAFKWLVNEHRLDGLAVECYSQVIPELGINPCFGYTSDDYLLACEGDVVLCLCYLMISYSGVGQPWTADLFALNEDGSIRWKHCAGPASLSARGTRPILGEQEAPAMLALENKFLTCRPKIPQGPVTLFRLHGVHLDKLHLAAGQLVGCDNEERLIFDIALSGDRGAFFEHLCGHHYVFVSGDQREFLYLLCNWLNIEVTET
jgi:L-fucose isomerase-like protein